MVDAPGYSYNQAISDDQMSMGTQLACKLENGAMFLSQISYPPLYVTV